MNNFTSSMIAYISCDDSDYTGYIPVSEVFDTALTANVTAILLYSRVSNYCNMASIGSSYPFVYSMIRANSSSALLNKITASTLQASITFEDEVTKTDSGSSSSSSSSSQQNPLGASPTTAVAMIILYSITGIITALFLVIIITGAVRAHRHPERYGPRNILGRPRQSRAKGLARAMLDTIPIVKFGETTEAAKPTDVELAENEMSSVHGDPEQIAVVAGKSDNQDPHSQQETEPRRSTQSARSGIAAANSSASDPQTDEGLICSICTDDFEKGQDLRVLPCDHKFHPACIDPWLLNVSGTCPLCRIDLNPPRSASTAGNNETENLEGATETGDLPPPLQGPVNVTRITMRQSFLIGLGMGRHDYSNREQRLAAVRRVREQQETQETQGQPQAAAEGEGRRRRRFRERFGIRTRRSGEEADAETEGAAPEQGLESLPENHTDAER